MRLLVGILPLTTAADGFEDGNSLALGCLGTRHFGPPSVHSSRPVVIRASAWPSRRPTCAPLQPPSRSRPLGCAPQRPATPTAYPALQLAKADALTEDERADFHDSVTILAAEHRAERSG